MTYIDNDKKRTKELCGHLPPWTQFIANNALSVIYTLHRPANICNGHSWISHITLSYMIIDLGSIAGSYTTAPQALVINNPTPELGFRISLNDMTLHRSRLQGIAMTSLFIVANYQNVVHVTTPRSRDKQVSVRCFDGPNAFIFPELPTVGQNMQSSAMAMTLVVTLDNDLFRNKRITNRLVFKFEELNNTLVELHYFEISDNKELLQIEFSQRSTLCTEGSVLMCAIQVLAPYESFVTASINRLNLGKPDFSSCDYSALVIREGFQSPTLPTTLGESTELGIHQFAPIYKVCNKVIGKGWANNADHKPRATYNKDRHCYKEQLALDDYTSITNYIIVVFYQYITPGMDVDYINIKLQLSLSTCQGFPFSCPVQRPFSDGDRSLVGAISAYHGNVRHVLGKLNTDSYVSLVGGELYYFS